jgi:hypothetical protein
MTQNNEGTRSGAMTPGNEGTEPLAQAPLPMGQGNQGLGVVAQGGEEGRQISMIAGRLLPRPVTLTLDGLYKHQDVIVIYPAREGAETLVRLNPN